MTLDVLLVGPMAHGGGEQAYMRTLSESPPPGVRYTVSGDFRQGAPGASPARLREVALNRLAHPRLIPDMGFRALRLRRRFDLVHVHAHPVSLSGRHAGPLIMSEGSSAAVYLQDYLGWSDERMETAFRRTRRFYRTVGIRDRLLAMERVDAVYVFSEWARQVNIRWGADPAKLAVIYPGFPVPPETARPRRDTFTFLFVGTDFERKGGFDVIEAFEAVAQHCDHARLLVVSPPPSQENPDRLLHRWVAPERRARAIRALERLERRGIARRMDLVPRSDLWQRVYPAADAFVMPSLAEGFGFTNVEAMSFGLPVVSSSIEPVREVVPDSVAGILVPPGDVGALGEAMTRLASDPRGAVSMGARARARFLDTFTMAAFHRRLGRRYAELAGAGVDRPCSPDSRGDGADHGGGPPAPLSSSAATDPTG